MEADAAVEAGQRSGRPPVPATHQLHRRGDEQRADDRCVDHHGECEAEAELLHRDDLARRESGEDDDDQQRRGRDDLPRALQTDRDRGTNSYTYDANGNVSTLTLATGDVETHYYDGLDRPTELWIGGFKRTQWAYDAAGQKGLLDKSTEYNYAGTTPYPYVIDVTGYDARNRPTGTAYTVPLQPGVTDGLNGTRDWRVLVQR